MYQALTRDASENCIGHWYEAYPTLNRAVDGKYFTFELMPNGSEDGEHLVENLKAKAERITVRTSFRHDFSSDSYVAAFGNLYKIDRIGIDRSAMRGIAVSRVKYTLYLIQCSNPLGL